MRIVIASPKGHDNPLNECSGQPPWGGARDRYGVDIMLGSRHEIASLQSNFYWYKFRKILRWLFFSIFVIFGLLIAIIYLILFQPSEHYYANTTNGKILPMPMQIGPTT